MLISDFKTCLCSRRQSSNPILEVEKQSDDPDQAQTAQLLGLFFTQRDTEIVSFMRLLTVMNLFFMLYLVCAFNSFFWCIFWSLTF